MAKTKKIKKLKIEYLEQKELDRYGIEDEEGWYVNDPNGDIVWVGPYSTKAETLDIRRGLERFYKYEYQS